MPLRFFLLVLFVLTAGSLTITQAQTFIEPAIESSDKPKSPLDYDIRNGATFNLSITNNGFAVGGQYRRVISPMTEALLEVQITALKDYREQTFFNFWGQQIIPNKYNRVLSFPIMFGLRHRIFANAISDNFRIYLQGSAGPAFTYVYPYFQDFPFIVEFFPAAGANADGLPLGVRIPESRINDMFQGWGDGSWELGYAGKASVTVDFGSSFRSLTAVEFGVQIFHYPNGIQIMEPNSLVFGQGGVITDRVIGGGFNAERWSITPTITLMFGGMW